MSKLGYPSDIQFEQIDTNMEKRKRICIAIILSSIWTWFFFKVIYAVMHVVQNKYMLFIDQAEADEHFKTFNEDKSLLREWADREYHMIHESEYDLSLWKGWQLIAYDYVTLHKLNGNFATYCMKVFKPDADADTHHIDEKCREFLALENFTSKSNYIITVFLIIINAVMK